MCIYELHHRNVTLIPRQTRGRRGVKGDVVLAGVTLGLALALMSWIPGVAAFSHNQKYGATTFFYFPVSQQVSDGTDGSISSSLSPTTLTYFDGYATDSAIGSGSSNVNSHDLQASLNIDCLSQCPDAEVQSSIYDTYTIECPTCTYGQAVPITISYEVTFAATSACEGITYSGIQFEFVGGSPLASDAYGFASYNPLTYDSGPQTYSFTGHFGEPPITPLELQFDAYVAGGGPSCWDSGGAFSVSDPFSVSTTNTGATVVSAAQQQCTSSPTTPGCSTSSGVPEFPLGMMALVVLAAPVLFAMRRRAAGSRFGT
jgi:hypothetical protein